MKYRQLPRTIGGVCKVLGDWGRQDLAQRIAYFASDDDLDEGDSPVTLDSARGFLAFWGRVESEGAVDLACSPEGWICAVWRFNDHRRVSLWFVDQDNVMYAARKSDGFFVDLNDGQETVSRSVVTEKLVKCGEWFTCSGDD